MQHNYEGIKLLEFQSAYHEIKDLKNYFEFLKDNYQVKEVEFYSKDIPTYEQIESFLPKVQTIKIIDYSIELPNTLNFRNFRFDFALKFKSLLDIFFKETSRNNFDKIKCLNAISNECDKLIQIHNNEDAVALVNHLIFKINTSDKGIQPILSFGGLNISEQIFENLRLDFSLRKYFFKELQTMANDKINAITIYIKANPPVADKNKLSTLRYLIYEFTAGVIEQKLITTSEKKDIIILEDKLFQVFNIDAGKRSDFIYEINKRANGNRGHNLNEMVNALQDQKIQ